MPMYQFFFTIMRDTSERYNMPDTLKAQYTAHLTKGNVAYERQRQGVGEYHGGQLRLA